MHLSKTTPLHDLKGAASLHVWHIADMLTRGDLTDFQRAYFLNEVAAGALKASGDIIDAAGLQRMMDEVVELPEPPKKRAPRAKRSLTPKKPVRRTRKPK